MLSEYSAQLLSPITKEFRGPITGDTKVIWIFPQETILAHSQEFIGGVHNITTQMNAKSSIGRSFLAVCKCAGRGDVGFYNRWTMEITNSSVDHAIPIVVGTRIAQISFFPTGDVKNSYSLHGTYQSSEITNTIAKKVDKNSSKYEELTKSWSPLSMLPKLYDSIKEKPKN